MSENGFWRCLLKGIKEILEISIEASIIFVREPLTEIFWSIIIGVFLNVSVLPLVHPLLLVVTVPLMVLGILHGIYREVLGIFHEIYRENRRFEKD